MGKGSRLSGPEPSTLPGADTALREVQYISALAVGAALPQGRLSRNSQSYILTSVSGEGGVKARLLGHSIKTFQQSLLFVAVYGSVHGQVTHPDPQYAVGHPQPASVGASLKAGLHPALPTQNSDLLSAEAVLTWRYVKRNTLPQVFTGSGPNEKRGPGLMYCPVLISQENSYFLLKSSRFLGGKTDALRTMH